ncbi:ATP-binding protein [Breoghania sp. JC706]|uniref:sensor histidine kinase n=1 Tax=Breoghania sp. JC706 TaxID=3117732 RepID=UPI003009C590
MLKPYAHGATADLGDIGRLCLLLLRLLRSGIRPALASVWCVWLLLAAIPVLAKPVDARAVSSPPIDLSVLEDGRDGVPLVGHLSVLRDPKGELSADEVVSGAKALRFEPVRGELALGYLGEIVWVKAVLRRGETSGHDRLPSGLTLALLPTFLDNITIYVPRVANPGRVSDFEVFLRGDHHVERKPGLGNLFFSVPLDLPDAAEVPIYIKIDSSSSIALRGSVLTRDGLRDYAISQAGFTVALLVLSLMAMLLSAVLWLLSRARPFLTFGLLMFANAMLILSDSGFLMLGGGESAHYWTDTILGLIIQFTILAVLLFVHDQVGARRPFSRLAWFFKGAIGFNLVALAVTLVDGDWYVVFAKPIYLFATISVIVLFAHNIDTFVRLRRPGSLPAAFATGSLLTLGLVDIIAIVGGPDLFGLGEAAYWAATAPFTLLMSLSMLIRAQHLDARRKVASGLRVLRRSEKRARALVEERTRELKLAKEAAEAALAAERQMQSEQLRFVDILRHQYQTPLAVIRSSAATLMKMLGADDEANRQRVQRIQVATSDLVDVLQVSLERSRMGDGLPIANFRPVDVHAFLAAVVRRFASAHADHVLAIDFDGIDAGDEVVFDPGLIAIALTNLLENSAKFSPSGTEIRVSAEREPRALRICVADEGMGVPEAEKAKVVQRYFRASNAGNVRGTGLGLHIVSHVMQAHEGCFRLENRQPRGTVACLELRLAPGAPGDLQRAGACANATRK